MKQKLCIALVIFPPILYFITIIIFWLGLSITFINPILSLILSSYISNKQSYCHYENNRKLLISIVKVVLLIIAYIAIVGYVHSFLNDFSWDGRQYHAEGISQLKQGFNPIYERLLPDQWGYGDPSVWINTLPKFSWVIGAVFYYIFDEISTSKLLLSYYLVPAIYYTSLVLRIYFDAGEANLIAGVLVLNPVGLSQIFTNYVDGIGYINLLLFAMVFIDYSSARPIFANKWYLLLFGLAAISTKFTNVIICILIVVSFSFLYEKIRAELFKLDYIVPAIIVSLMILFNPYLTNLYRYGNIAYPLYNTKIIKSGDFELNNAPEAMKRIIYDSNHSYLSQKTVPYALYESIFSMSANDNKEAIIKYPYEVAAEEFRVFRYPDVRVGGFGPLYQLGLMASIFALCIIVIRNQLTRNQIIIILVSFLSIGLSLVTPNSWWARYVSYLWAIPIIWTSLTLSVVVNKFRVVNKIILYILLINSLLILSVSVAANVRDSIYYRISYITDLKNKSKNGPIGINCDFNKDLIDLREHQIQFYCKKISAKLFENYLEKSNLNVSIEHFYNRNINEASLLTNTDVRVQAIKFFGEILTVKENLEKNDILDLALIYSENLKFKVNK